MPNSFLVLADAPEQEEVEEIQTIKASRPDQDEPLRQKKVKNPLCWLDLEMTGLDLDKDTIIEVACVITDGDLKVVAEGPDIAIHHPDEVLDCMNAWCVEHHGKSGLTQRCRDSCVSLIEAEEQVLAFLQEHAEQGRAILAGNSVHVDLAFLKRHMPTVASHLHYRIVDVSTIKELAKRWYPRVFSGAPRKVLAHTAMSDVMESIEELRYYREAVFRQKPAPSGGAGAGGVGHVQSHRGQHSGKGDSRTRRC